MDDQQLTNVRKIEIFGLITKAGLIPANFIWTAVPSRSNKQNHVSLCRYMASRYFFIFDTFREQFKPELTPGSIQTTEVLPANSAWPYVTNNFSNWLNRLKAELAQPDPWEQFLSSAKIAEETGIPPTEGPNNPFTYQEVQHITKGIEDIKRTLQTFTPNIEKLPLISQQLDAITESSKTMGRKDWFIIAIGTFVNLATAMAFTPDQTRIMFQALKTLVMGFLHIQQLPPH